MAKTSDAQLKAIAKYDAENTTQVKMKLNNIKDADILEHLQRIENVQGYIKALIREDIEKKLTEKVDRNGGSRTDKGL